MQKSCRILRLLFKFESDYLGLISSISGNALRHAISRQVNVSNGQFCKLQPLIQPQNYHSFFSLRTDVPPQLAHRHCWYDKYHQEQKVTYFFSPEAVTFDVIDPPNDFIKYLKQRDLIQFGKGRNKGYGLVRLVDAIEIKEQDIELPTEASHLTLLSPMFYIPKFIEPYKCRSKTITFWNHNTKKEMTVIFPKQFFRLKKGVNIKRIARKGMLRKFLFGKFGFGEFILHDWIKGGQ